MSTKDGSMKSMVYELRISLRQYKIESKVEEDHETTCVFVFNMENERWWQVYIVKHARDDRRVYRSHIFHEN